MSVPTISVIIPAYNSAATILETIGSVQQQTYSDFEIIVIDDGSTDHTLELLKTIHEPRLKVFSYANSGVAVARNRGIAHSVGEYLSFLDADDLWSSDKLELQLATLKQQSDAAIVYSWTRFNNELNLSFQDDVSVSFTGNVLEPLLLKNFIASGSNILVKRAAVEVIGRFDPDMTPAEDWDFYLRLAAVYPFAVVPKVQIFYRQARESASAKIEKMKTSSLKVIEKNFQSAPKRVLCYKKQSIARIYQYIAELYLRYATHKEDVVQSAKELWNSFNFYPAIVFEREFQKLIIWLVKAQFKLKSKSYPVLFNTVFF